VFNIDCLIVVVPMQKLGAEVGSCAILALKGKPKTDVASYSLVSPAILYYNLAEGAEAIENHLKNWLHVVDISMRQLFLLSLEPLKLQALLETSHNITYWTSLPRMLQTEPNWNVINMFIAKKRRKKYL
jgi:hypothetical protein